MTEWSFDPERFDLAEVTALLARRVDPAQLGDYLPGKTVLRDVLMAERELSALEAEQLVDQLERMGFARFEGAGAAPSRPSGVWTLHPDALAPG